MADALIAELQNAAGGNFAIVYQSLQTVRLRSRQFSYHATISKQEVFKEIGRKMRQHND